jgi:hypothetical protein
MTFDAIKAHILRMEEDGEEGGGGGGGGAGGGQLSNVESLFAGSFAGFVSCTCTYPLDLARARLAVERTPAGGVGAVAGVAGAGGGAGGGGAGGGGGMKGTRTAHSVLYIFRAAYHEGVRACGWGFGGLGFGWWGFAWL